MPKLFNNKYRIKSIRLQDYDYSLCGSYYVTICTKNRKCFFGDIVNGKMKLSGIGEIVLDEWIKTGQIRQYVQLDEFVVMPDHFHGIVIIENNEMVNVETCRSMSLRKRNQFSKPLSNSISMIINHFKSAVKRWCNKNGFEYFQWQRGFYEHIIRDKNELNQKRQYIINNPQQWTLNMTNQL